MLRLPNIVLLTQDELQAKTLRFIFKHYLLFTHIRSFPELKALSDEGKLDALFCDWRLGNNEWKSALDSIRYSHPDLPIIFLSRNGGRKEWLQALDAGAYDLLIPPYSGASLLAAVERAAANCKAKEQHLINTQARKC